MLVLYYVCGKVILYNETWNVPYICIMNNVMKAAYVPEIFRNIWNVPYI